MVPASPTAHTSVAEVPQIPLRCCVVPLDALDQKSKGIGGGAVTVVVVNDTTGRPATVAVAVFVPIAIPVVNFAAALPLASVVTIAGAMLPPPAVTANATRTPYLGKLAPSETITRMESGKLSPATTFTGSPPTLATAAAALMSIAVESLV